jgi:hypothetical protein
MVPPIPREMLMRSLASAAVLLLAALVLAPAANAQLASARVLPYEGELFDEGEPAEGSYVITFTLHADATTEDALFSETRDIVAVGGRFSAVLGEQSGNPLPDALYLADELRIALEVDGTPLSGRQRIVALPFANVANEAHDLTAHGVVSLRNGLVDARLSADDEGGLELDTGVNGGNAVFVKGDARDNSIFVGSQNIGVGTDDPTAYLHVVGGDIARPFLHLERDASEGQTPQTWGLVIEQESSFGLRDVTNGQSTPFFVKVGAPSSSLIIDGNGDLGLRTNLPEASVHITRTDGTASIRVDETSSTTANRSLLRLENNGRPDIDLHNSDSGDHWQIAAGDSLMLNKVGSGSTSLQLSGAGDLTVAGDVYSNTCDGSPCAPDYVFADDYPLRSLDELERFVERERHLPGVPSAEEMKGPINLGALQMKLLEKVEELTLYTLQQQKDLETLRRDNRALRERLERVERASKR